MIDRLEIRNFKSIAAAELAFGRVNLFIGVNGSGKSNLLEAIGLYTVPVSAEESTPVFSIPRACGCRLLIFSNHHSRTGASLTRYT